MRMPRFVIPLKNGEGSFQAHDSTIEELEGEGRVVFRYLDVNPNGSRNDIAGITNEAGTIVGLMPHPEHAVEAGFGPDGADGIRTGVDGLPIFQSLMGVLRSIRRYCRQCCVHSGRGDAVRGPRPKG